MWHHCTTQHRIAPHLHLVLWAVNSELCSNARFVIRHESHNNNWNMFQELVYSWAGNLDILLSHFYQMCLVACNFSLISLAVTVKSPVVQELLMWPMFFDL